MTKNEIYERVVQLTGELAQTKVAQKIFAVAMQGDAKKAQAIIDAFSEYYPELYQKISSFGEEINKLAGAWAMKKVEEEFKEKGLSIFGDNNAKYVEEVKKLSGGATGWEAAIFGKETDEENGLFIFDPNIIDVLSFYALCIFGKICDSYFHYDYEWDKDPKDIDENCEEIESEWFQDELYDAMKQATNEAFANYMICYNIVAWAEDDEESVGEILVAALAGEFEDEVEEDAKG